MSALIDSPGASVGEWSYYDIFHIPGIPDHAHGICWQRVLCGWPDERPAQTVQVHRGIDVNGDPYVSVNPQRQFVSGQSKGKWTEAQARGDFHSREDFRTFLNVLIEAGTEAGWLDESDLLMEV